MRLIVSGQRGPEGLQSRGHLVVGTPLLVWGFGNLDASAQVAQVVGMHVDCFSKQRREAFAAERVGVSQLKLVRQRILRKEDPRIAWLVPVETLLMSPSGRGRNRSIESTTMSDEP